MEVRVFVFLALLPVAMVLPLGLTWVSAQSKYLGNIFGSASEPTDFSKDWNQVTPENAGKWGEVEKSRGSYYWSTLDSIYNYAKNKGFLFKYHTLVWGSEQPSWMTSLSQGQQKAEVEEWIQAVSQRYPNMDLVDVVNEPLHDPPPYKIAIGGDGSTGWDWVIWAFQTARKYCSGKLLINEYGCESSSSESDNLIIIINLLKDRGLIDGIGLQGHGLEGISADTIKSNLDKFAATGLPIYISEYDVGEADDTQQLNIYKAQFPVFWEHSDVQGVTLWGYIQGQIWKTNAYLLKSDGTERPALTWLMQYVARAPPITYDVHLESRQDNSAAANLGSIYFDGTSYSPLPKDVSKASGRYSIKYVPEDSTYSFVRWETSSSSIAVDNPNQAQTYATVNGVGTLRAIYIKQMTLAKGMNIVAWSSEAYSSSNFAQSLGNLHNLGADWVCLTVFWFMPTKYSNDISPISSTYFPATSSDSSLRHAIQEAKSLGMKVCLRPIVGVLDGTWRAEIQPASWETWFANYRTFLNKYATLGNEEEVDLFVVGTELSSSQSHTSEWESVISDARTHFGGPITYATNWDMTAQYGIDDLAYWDRLDYIGVDAYYPLTDSNFNPTVDDLKNGWYSWVAKFQQLSQVVGKKILFIEIGYRSVDGANIQPWDWESPGNLDLDEQARCYQAALEVFQNEAWFQGWFWWEWEVDPNAGGSNDRGFTAQGKPAERILKIYYSSVRADVNADGSIDMKDIAFIAKRYMCPPSDPLWDVLADVNGDRRIDMKDIALAAKHFGEHYP